MKQLRCLRLAAQPGVDQSLRWLAAVLRSIPTVNVMEDLTIGFAGFYVGYGTGSSQWQWSDIDRIVAAWDAPTLRRIKFTFSPMLGELSPSDGELSTFLRREVRLLASTGILTIIYNGDTLFPYART